MSDIIRESYVVIKELPDADVGTIVHWDEYSNSYYYDKNAWVSPHRRHYLTAGQVTQTPEYFCTLNTWPHYFAWINPVYNRREIFELLELIFPNDIVQNTGSFKINISKQIRVLKSKLIELGKTNTQQILKQYE